MRRRPEGSENAAFIMVVNLFVLVREHELIYFIGTKSREWDREMMEWSYYWTCCLRSEYDGGCEDCEHQAEEVANKRIRL
jgi:hypothetical protein